MESYIEYEDYKREKQLEYNALRKILGHVLLEQNLGKSANEDIAYYSRKLKEVQSLLR